MKFQGASGADHRQLFRDSPLDPRRHRSPAARRESGRGATRATADRQDHPRSTGGPRMGLRLGVLRQGSGTLAGRIAFHELDGLSLEEVSARRAQELWLRGGFPRSFVAPRLAGSLRWRQNFIDTFVERDLPQLGFRVPGTTLRRFWSMLSSCRPGTRTSRSVKSRRRRSTFVTRGSCTRYSRSRPLVT